MAEYTVKRLPSGGVVREPVKNSVKKSFKDSPILTQRLDTRRFYDPHRLETIEADYAVKAIPALFMTTPLLNLTKTNVENNHFLKYISETDPELLSLLSFGVKTDNSSQVNTSPFIKLISNRFESFTTKATTSQPREVGETFYGFKQYLPGPYINSISGDSISIEYTETGGMEILQLHKIWLDYIENISRGIFKPSRTASFNRYLDFTSSIYLFNLAPDGETILFWEKLTGCSPISVPYDVFSSKAVNDKEIIRYSIEYVYSYKEDLNPRSIQAFNTLARSKNLSKINSIDLTLQDIPVLNSTADYTNTSDPYAGEDMYQAYSPIIVQGKDAEGRPVFKLKYTEATT